MPQQKKCIIIAEAGVNHNGDVNLAKQMIDLAADAGADIIKFQTFISENVIAESAVKAANSLILLLLTSNFSL